MKMTLAVLAITLSVGCYILDREVREIESIIQVNTYAYIVGTSSRITGVGYVQKCRDGFHIYPYARRGDEETEAILKFKEVLCE